MYLAQGAPLTSDALAALVALIPQIDLAPGPGGSRITPLDVPQTVAAVRSLPVDLWLDVQRLSLIALYPSSQLVAHVDPPLPGRRLHLPLATNPGCWSFSDGRWMQLELGRAYAMDPSVIHGAVNWGTMVRVHLMVDLRG